MLLSCSDKVSNITISPSSPKNCYKPISKIAPIYSAKTVSSSRWQRKLLSWIMPVSFRGVYQRGSITHGPKSAIGRPCTSPSLLQAAGVLPWNSLLLLLRTQDGAQSHYYMATLEAVQLPVQADTGTQCEILDKSPKIPTQDLKTNFDGLQPWVMILFINH